MHELQSLIACAGMWVWISSEIDSADIGESIQLEILKEIYCADNNLEWRYDCALCESTLGWDYNKTCGKCPLLYFWGSSTTKYTLPCCAEESPYTKTDEWLFGGDHTEAIASANQIIDECDRQIKWWANLKEMNQ